MTRIATITHIVDFLNRGTDHHGYELFDRMDDPEYEGEETQVVELRQAPTGDLWYVGPVGLRARGMTASEGMHSLMLTLSPPEAVQVTVLDAEGAPVAAYAAV